MRIERIGWGVSVGFAAALLTCAGQVQGTPNLRQVDLLADVAAWQHDGHWRIEPTDDGVRFWKDDLPAHNSTAFLRLPKRDYRGWRIRIRYRMEVPYKHIDIYVGQKCEYRGYVGMKVGDIPNRDDHGRMKEVEGVWSLGGRPETDWQEREFVIGSDEPIDTLGILCWGWPIDRSTSVWVAHAELQAPTNDTPRWIPWPFDPQRNREPPSRHITFDKFPVGVYLSRGGFSSAWREEGFADEWAWWDDVLDDLATRDIDHVYVVNVAIRDVEQLLPKFRQHGVRMIPQAGETVLARRNLENVRHVVARHGNDPTILGWGFGEELSSRQRDALERMQQAHEWTRQMQTQPIITIHNRAEGIAIDAGLSRPAAYFRDVYPLFNDPYNGPATDRLALAFYEDQLELMRSLGPKGAYFMVMAQGCSIRRHGSRGYPPEGLLTHRQVTPAEIRLQAWAAVAHGARGLSYFHLASTPADTLSHKGLNESFNGLRGRGGVVTPQLEELGRVARELHALSDVLLSLAPAEMTAQTDHRDLGAYLHEGRESRYVVVFNRNANHATRASVRLPADCSALLDLKSQQTLLPDAPRVFTISLLPGDGTILQLQLD